MKITLLYSTLEVIVSKSSIESSEFSSYIGEFELVNIDIKYPTTSFETIYEQVLNLRKKYEEQIQTEQKKSKQRNLVNSHAK